MEICRIGLVSVPALQAKVKLWKENFVALDLAAGTKPRQLGFSIRAPNAIGAGEEALLGAFPRAGAGRH